METKNANKYEVLEAVEQKVKKLLYAYGWTRRQEGWQDTEIGGIKMAYDLVRQLRLDERPDCDDCDGTGIIEDWDAESDADREYRCSTCDGEGVV